METTTKNARWKKMLKKYGIWGIVFFVVKGTISTILIILGLDSLSDLF
jgi:hypothetical protein